MENLKIEERIKEKLDEYGFKSSDLTLEELNELKEEIEAEQRGEIVIDGVLASMTPFRKRLNKNGE